MNWLPNSLLKGFEKPTIVLEENIGQKYSGFYITGSPEIVVVSSDIKEMASTIAHETMHYAQWLYGKLGDVNSAKYWNQVSSNLSYNKAIRAYFKKFPTEMEALEFQHRVAPTECTRFWLQGLILPDKEPCDYLEM